MPVVTVALLIDGGSAQDPADRLGLASLTADLVDVVAGGRDVVQLAEAFGRFGTQLSIEVSHDTITLSFTTLARNLDATLALLADVVVRPHLAEADLARIRDLRLSRIRQLKTSAGAVADRAFLQGLFGAHPWARHARPTRARGRRSTTSGATTADRFWAAATLSSR